MRYCDFITVRDALGSVVNNQEIVNWMEKKSPQTLGRIEEAFEIIDRDLHPVNTKTEGR